jgi:hypothetical protein
LFQQAFRSGQELLHVTIGFRTKVGAIEDRNLEKGLGSVPPLGREHHPMSGRIRVLQGLSRSNDWKNTRQRRWKSPHEFMMLQIITERQVARILKGGIEVELEPDLNDVACPIFDAEGGMIETDLSLNDHLV